MKCLKPDSKRVLALGAIEVDVILTLIVHSKKLISEKLLKLPILSSNKLESRVGP